MPSQFLQAEPLARLIEQERVTVAGAVPTIWMDLLRFADEHMPDLSSLRCVPDVGVAGTSTGSTKCSGSRRQTRPSAAKHPQARMARAGRPDQRLAAEPVSAQEQHSVLR